MKNLLVCAAAAAAMVCAAQPAGAKTKSVSISFDGFCDGLDIVVNTADRTALETANGCDQGVGFGAGTIGKIKNRGNAITFGVNLSAKGGAAYQYIFIVDYPVVTGGKWSEFYTTDGKTLQGKFTGTYTVTGGAGHKARGLRSSTGLTR